MRLVVMLLTEVSLSQPQQVNPVLQPVLNVEPSVVLMVRTVLEVLMVVESQVLRRPIGQRPN